MAQWSTILWVLVVLGVGRPQVVADGRAPLVRFVQQPDGVFFTSRGGSANFSCAAVDSADKALPVKWTLNGRSLPSRVPLGVLRVVDVSEDDEGVYRCVAQVDGVGAVLSKAGKLRLDRPAQLRHHPASQQVRIGQSVRFECVVDLVVWPLIHWLHNGLPLADDIRHTRLSTSDSGILQIVAVELSDAGEYQCIVSSSSSAVNVTSRAATLSTTSSDPELFDSKAALKAFAPPQNATSELGKDVVFECMFEENVQVSWKRVDSGVFDASRAVRVGPNLHIKAVELGDGGVYACTGSTGDGEAVELRAHLFIQTPPIIVSSPEDQTKRQGVSVRFQCPSIGHSEPSLTWYKDGVELKPAGRIKMHPTTGVTALRDEQDASAPVQFVRDLLISEVQTGDEGVYQCVVANSAGETSASAVLHVQANISAAPKNFRAEVDQKRAAIRFFWEAPDTVASDTPYYVLLTFYLTDGGVSNTIVLENVDCKERQCSASCCKGYSLEPFHNYTFQMSMVVVGQAIGPLSEKITAITWDGVASESAPLQVSGLADRGVHLEWTEPNKLPGKLEQYRIEHYEEIDADVEAVQVPFIVTTRNFHDLIPNGTYYFRVVPKTRAGYPADSALSVRKQFPWVQYTVPAANANGGVEVDVVAPTLRVDNINETAWLVVWEADRSAAKFVVAYRSLADGGEKRRMVVDGGDRSVVLMDGLVKGATYEISVFSINAAGERGLAATQLLHVPLKPPTTTRAPAASDLKKPKPVMCQPPCTCEPVGGGVMQLGWIRPNGGSSKITYYLAHYTLDENDGTKERRIFRTEVESAQMIGMASNTTYQVRIDACNNAGCRDGQVFDCTTPIFSVPPAPTDISWTEKNNSLIELQWKQVPLGNWSAPTGYVIYLNEQGGETRTVFVDGADSTHVTIASLVANRFYMISLATRSQDGTGDASRVLIAKLKPDKPDVLVVYSYKEGILVGVCIALLFLAISAFVLYMRFRADTLEQRTERGSSRSSSWTTLLFRRRRRTPAGAVKLMGSGLNGVFANGTAPGAGKSEQVELDELLPPTIENGQSDAKGGDEGARPSGCSRYTQLVNERRFEAVHNWTSADTSPLPSTHLGLSRLVVHVDGDGGLQDERGRVGDMWHSGRGADVSSDLSHSPVTASSLQSWSHEERMSHPATSSLPNLTDSGIGFDDFNRHQRPKLASNRCWCRLETGTHPMHRPDGLMRSTPRSAHTTS